MSKNDGGGVLLPPFTGQILQKWKKRAILSKLAIPKKN